MRCGDNTSCIGKTDDELTNLRFLTLASLLTASTFAADAPQLPAVAAAKEKQMSGELRKPAEPTAKKKELLFSDDFMRAELEKDKG